MKIRALVIVFLFFYGAGTALAEEAWFRQQILSGLDLIFNADIGGGERVFESLEKKDPSNPAPYIYRAMALMSYPPREGMKQIDRKFIVGLLNTGIERAKSGSWGEDEGRVKLLTATGYSLLAQISLEQRRYLKAADEAVIASNYLKEASRLSPDDGDIRYGTGILSYGMSELPAALAPILSILSVRGDKKTGIDDLMAAAKNGVYTKTSARMALLVIFCNIESRYTEAVVYGNLLIAEYPNNPELYFLYANALSESGDEKRAFSVALSLKKKMDQGLPYFDGAIVPRYHHLMGKLLMDENRLDEAAAEFTQAIVVTDKNYDWVKPLALARLGMVEDLRGRRKEAEIRYREALGTGIEGAGRELARKYLKTPYKKKGGK